MNKLMCGVDSSPGRDHTTIVISNPRQEGKVWAMEELTAQDLNVAAAQMCRSLEREPAMLKQLGICTPTPEDEMDKVNVAVTCKVKSDLKDNV